MNEPQPRRSWWRRKRTWAAVALWLIVAYPASFYPALYCQGRRWTDFRFTTGVYGPLLDAVDAASIHEWEMPSYKESPWWRRAVSDAADGYFQAALWCVRTGQRHRAASD